MTDVTQRLTPLQGRIVGALLHLRNQTADWYELGRLLWPPEEHPKAWNYSSNGGPPGWAMRLSRAVRQLERAGLLYDDWRAPGRRTVRLAAPSRTEGVVEMRGR